MISPDAGPDPDALPVYAVRFTPYALRSLESAIGFVYDHCGKEGAEAAEYATEFVGRLYVAVGTLATLPNRYPLAGEVRRFAPPPVRVLPYRQQPGSPVWRVLYRVHEADANEGRRVEVVTVQHSASRPLTRQEAQAIDAANR